MIFRQQGTTEPSDENLMQCICKGERWAFGCLYDRYFDKLVWFARSFLQDEQKAEDAIQEIFIRIIEHPEKFDATKKFSTWVYTLTGNYCKNILRDEQNRNRIIEQNVLPQQNKQTQLHEQSDYHLLKDRIKKACEQLNEKEKNVFALRFEQDLSIKEIADILDMPEGSVKSSIYYLLKKVSPHLKDFTYEN